MNWKKIKVFLPIVLGALGGFLYYNFIGCNGSCAITGSPVNSTLYGSLIGLVLTDWKQIKLLFNNKSRIERDQTEKEEEK
ncbi:MAG: hypothetical protein OQJ93_03985 [Ignavibacteriaceae bacterium]|jgi:hypothetical protein|nr:hypothetical protein [Ignavibacteriaceae bacterium]MCW8812159.1 hypothetical protein [Chlorobium sp.]MCW8824716.1 hypothetical protein [Ignavibacteriaceae bacterium]MCW8959986.1 hypothetical protein [Ignavibacteriaceae bacterium]MCW9096527.1 hypothetical protein [Ignavibacteriaceae bacterium]